MPPPDSISPAPRRRTPWIIGAVVLALAVMGLFLLLAQPRPPGSASATGARSPVTGTRSPVTASPSAALPSDAAADTARPTATPDLAAEVEAIKDQVAPIRELEERTDVPARFLDADGLERELRELTDEESPPEEIAVDERLLKRLGLLPEDADLRALVLELLGDAIAGFYNPDEERLVIVQRSGDFGALERFTIAHEFTHALQDQHYDLDQIRPEGDAVTSDADLARLAFVEGDAQLLSFLWAQENLGLSEIADLLTGSATAGQEDILARMPPILRRQLLFPYFEGLSFVQGLYTAGGWEAVDAVYADPPDSTEQILHPERYPDDQPTTLDAADRARELGAGWTRVTSDTFGELYTQVWLAQSEPADPDAQATAAAAAAGWDGDTVTMYEGDDDAWAIEWRTTWDGADDAAEFRAAADAVVAALPDAGDVIAGTDAEVTILIAGDAGTLDDLRAAAASN